MVHSRYKQLKLSKICSMCIFWMHTLSVSFVVQFKKMFTHMSTILSQHARFQFSQFKVKVMSEGQRYLSPIYILNLSPKISHYFTQDSTCKPKVYVAHLLRNVIVWGQRSNVQNIYQLCIFSFTCWKYFTFLYLHKTTCRTSVPIN